MRKSKSKKILEYWGYYSIVSTIDSKKWGNGSDEESKEINKTLKRQLRQLFISKANRKDAASESAMTEKMMKALFVSGALKYDEMSVWACTKCEGTDIVLKSQDPELYEAFVRWIDAERESPEEVGK